MASDYEINNKTAKAADLRFPLQYDNNLAWAVFKPYDVRMNAPTTKTPPRLAIVPTTRSVFTTALYLPGDYNESVSAQWSYQDIIGGAGTTWGSKLASAGSELLNTMGVGSTAINTASIMAGKTLFPNDINIFNGASPIEAAFNFRMMPMNKAEGLAMLNIIQNFKSAIFPTLSSADAAFLTYPPIWNIFFIGIKGMGFQDPYYEAMALVGCNITYSGGTGNMMKFHDNTPVEATLSLRFQSIKKAILGDNGVDHFVNNPTPNAQAAPPGVEGKGSGQIQSSPGS